MESKTFTAIINVDTGPAQIYGFEILLGIGTGCFVQAGYAVIFSMLEPGDLAFATSYMMLGKFFLRRPSAHITC
jgi:hypothetical protein